MNTRLREVYEEYLRHPSPVLNIKLESLREIAFRILDEAELWAGAASYLIKGERPPYPIDSVELDTLASEIAKCETGSEDTEALIAWREEVALLAILREEVLRSIKSRPPGRSP